MTYPTENLMYIADMEGLADAAEFIISVGKSDEMSDTEYDTLLNSARTLLEFRDQLEDLRIRLDIGYC